MGAPSPELCNLWLARAFNAQDVEAAAAMYHPDATIVRVDEVHGETESSRGAQAIRETMAAYINMKPHMDVVTHHTTISGDFAMTRSQWLIAGVDKPRPAHRSASPRHGSASPPAGRQLGILHGPSVRRGSELGNRAPAEDGMREPAWNRYSSRAGAASPGATSSGR